MKDVLKVLAGVLLGLGLFLAGFLTGRSVGRHENDPKPLPDPQVIHEDVTIEVRPQLIASGTLKETVRVEVRDTVHHHHHDTTYVFDIPREVKVYADSSYRAVVSGLDPRLDSLTIHTYKETILQPYEVTRWKERSRWGLSVQGGYGIGAGGLTPYIGVGVSYRLLDF